MSATRAEHAPVAGASRSSAAPRLLVLAAILVVAIALGVAWGTEPISLSRAITDASSLDREIAIGVRLPRVALGAIAGAGLAMVGATFQSILRNPLAEPYVLGVSGGAALGATIAIVLGASALTWVGASIVPLAAFVGGVGATAVVWAFARASRRTHASSSGTAILLAGVVVNAIAAAAITFVKTLVAAEKAQELLYWLMGFLDVPTLTSLACVAIYVAIGAALLLRDAPRINLLALGDEAAQHVGVDVRALERRTFIVASLVTGAVVSATGLIGFVGLLVPHAVRRVFGPDARIVLPASMLGGAATLVACDLFGRTLFRLLHTEPPVGAVTALVGGPLFLVILRRRPGA